MLFEVWFISIMILVIALFFTHGNISLSHIIKSFLPTTFSNNWYITCYLLFYPIHPLLNLIIDQMDEKKLFRMSLALFVIYYGFCFIYEKLFYASDIIRWITIYFIIAYIKKYKDDKINSNKHNIILLLVGGIGYLGGALLANTLGLHISFLSNKILHWITNGNPFLLFVSIAMFNLMRNISFNNKVINYTSSLSLIIYIVHENLLFRIYFRPYIWIYISEFWLFSCYLVGVYCFAFGIFVWVCLCLDL